MSVEGQGSGQARRASLLAVVGRGVLRRQLHQFEPHLAHSRTDQTNLSGYPIGYINFAPFLVGTPVIDAHQLKLPVAGVDDADPGTKRQIRMRCRQALRIESLTVGGLLSIESGAIPAGVTDPYLNWLH